jgi:putative PIN family toxin of toxin-antitoxin system
MKVALDANVLVSGLTSTGTPSSIVDLWLLGAFDLILSEHILLGVRQAWTKPYFRRFFREDEIDPLLARISGRAKMFMPTTSVRGVAEDLEDDLVLATAVVGRADFLVTGDRVLREIGEYAGVRIVTPRELLDVLEEPLTSDLESSP